MQVSLVLSETAVRDLFIKTGKVSTYRHECALPMEELSEDSRRIIAIYNPNYHPSFSLEIADLYEPGSFQRTRTSWKVDALPQTPQEWDTLFARYHQAVHQRREENHELLQAHFDTDLADLKAGNKRAFASDWKGRYAGCRGLEEVEAIYKRMEDEEKAREREREERLIQQREARRKERNIWIAEHGSEILKRMVAREYDCQRHYVRERAAIEHPGFAVDFDNECEYRPRYSPGPRAFEIAEEHGGRVVFLTKPSPVFHDEDEPWESCEAVVIEDYLGNYRLVMPF